MSQSHKKTPHSQSDALWNLLFSIVLPVMVLNKLSDRLGDQGPLWALLIALSFPTFYSLYEFRKRKKINPISILGFVNVLATGGLALMKLQGIWFAVKEALFPFMIGIGVALSARWKNPWIKSLVLNDQMFDVEKIERSLQERQNLTQFDAHLRMSTRYLAYTFYLSALLNFALASYIFTEIPSSLSEAEQASILNQQIADMTWKSYFVIMVPSMLSMLLLFRYLLQGIHRYTGLGFQDIVLDPKQKS